MDMVASHGHVALITKVILRAMTFKVKVFINGKMVEHITALGTITKWKVKVFSPGQMAEVTKVITTTIRKRDKVLSSGLMEENTREDG